MSDVALRTFSCVGAAATLAGCLSGAAEVRPLYPETVGHLPESEIATLSGYVQSVDGRDIGENKGTYGLLPGCHVIRTPSRWGAGGLASSVTATTGSVPFAVPMQRGHRYSIVVRTEAMTGPTGRLDIVAVERNAEGEVTHEFGWAQTADDLARCGR